MNQKASVMMEILIFLVVAVFLSAAILFLVKSGVLETKSSYEEANVLNTEFLPTGRTGTLVLKEFEFCGYIDEDFNCVDETNEFARGNNVYVLLVIETSPYNGEIIVERNYQMLNPDNEVVLQLDERNTYTYAESSTTTKEVVIADLIKTLPYFTLGKEYTLQAVVKQPLLQKEIKASQKFILTSELYGYEVEE